MGKVIAVIILAVAVIVLLAISGIGAKLISVIFGIGDATYRISG